MPISSINFKNVKPNSEAHNLRHEKLDYNYPELEKDNEHWQSATVCDVQQNIAKSCKELSGRKLQKNAHSVREAVVNLEKHHKMEHLKHLGDVLKASYGISCFAIHIHRDEGKNPLELNYHAHMLFDWQDKEKGTMLRIKNHDLANIQSLVAETLGLDRGKQRVNGKAVNQRLEPVAYKKQQDLKQEIKRLQGKTKILEEEYIQEEYQLHLISEEKDNQTKKLHAEIQALEQKKNELEPFNFSSGKLLQTTVEIKKFEGRIKSIREDIQKGEIVQKR